MKILSKTIGYFSVSYIIIPSWAIFGPKPQLGFAVWSRKVASSISRWMWNGGHRAWSKSPVIFLRQVRESEPLRGSLQNLLVHSFTYPLFALTHGVLRSPSHTRLAAWNCFFSLSNCVCFFSTEIVIEDASSLRGRIVILHLSWYTCPNPEMQILWDGGSIVTWV